jgi:hypothetical protein
LAVAWLAALPGGNAAWVVLLTAPWSLLDPTLMEEFWGINDLGQFLPIGGGLINAGLLYAIARAVAHRRHDQ